MSTIKDTITKKSKLWVRTHNSSKTLLKGGELRDALELLETAEAKFLLKNETDFIKASQRNATKKRIFLIFFFLSALSGGVYYFINKPPSVEIVKLDKEKIQNKQEVEKKTDEQQIKKPKVIVEQNDSVESPKNNVVKIAEPIKQPINQVEVNNQVEKIEEPKKEESLEKYDLGLAKKFVLANNIANSNDNKNGEKIIFNSLYDVSIQNIRLHSSNNPNGLLLNKNQFLMVEDNKMVIWDIKKQVEIKTLKQKAIKNSKLSPNKNLIAIITKNQKLKVWDLKKVKLFWHWILLLSEMLFLIKEVKKLLF